MAASPIPPPGLSVPAGVPTLLRDLLHEHTGIYFESDRLDLLLDKLHDRVEALGFRSYLDYYYVLKYEASAETEWRRVMDALSVQETYFWREIAQVRAVVDCLVPAWFKRTAAPLRIWSAACATGEEPYTLAMALCEAGWADHPITIVASDASDAALAKAQKGCYRERSFRTLPAELRAKYFDAPNAEGSRLRRELLPSVTFHRANLVATAEIAPLADSPVVFCRNVFIYFSADAIRRTVASFASFMPDGGHLFVGTSESLLKVTRAFELREVGDAFVYVKSAPSS
jgi:chemotaxis protein methyltransferase CheR